MKSIGNRNILTGSILLILGVFLTVGSFLLFKGSGQKTFIVFTGLIWVGLYFIIRGALQYFSTKNELQAARYTENTLKYGVEEPDRTWDCPYCGNINPNTTFICQRCRKKL